MRGAGRIAKNTFILIAVNLLLPVSSLATVVVVARCLGTEGLGRYSLVFSFFNVFSSISLLGLNAVITREGASVLERLPKLLSNAAILGTIASLLLMVVMGTLGSWLGYDEATRVALVILSIAILPATILKYFEATCIACERMEFIGLFTLSENILRIALSVVLLVLGHGISAIMIVAVGTRILACLVYMLFVHKLGLALRWTPDLRVLRQLVFTAPTFTLISVFAVLYSKIDIFMLSKIGEMNDVGVYGAGYRILEIAMVLPASLCLSVYPGLARASSANPETVRLLGSETLRYLLVMTLPLAVGATLLAKPIMNLLYGEAFRPASVILTVLVWTVIPYAWVRYYAYVLVAANRQKIDLCLNVIMAGVNIVLNLLLIPRYGSLGAALATTVSICVYAVGQYIYIRRYLSDRLAQLPALFKPAFAIAVMAVSVWVLRDVQVLLTIAIGAVVYVGALWVTRFFTDAEREIIFHKLSLAQIGLRK